jgi:hypothetical protein
VNSRSSAQINRKAATRGEVWSGREGVEEVNRDPGKKDPEFTEKNFVRLLIFFRLLFSDESSRPNWDERHRGCELRTNPTSRNVGGLLRLYVRFDRMSVATEDKSLRD